MTDNSMWMPRINQSLCTGCGDCIAQCPTGALGWENGKAALLHPEVCIYCQTCESVCPVGAIELPYLVCIRSESDSVGGYHEQQTD